MNELQCRGKWHKEQANIKPGTLVILKETNLPLKAKVTGCIPGNDGVVRVVYLRTSSGPAKRTISEICPLPQGHREIDIEHTGNNQSVSPSDIKLHAKRTPKTIDRLNYPGTIKKTKRETKDQIKNEGSRDTSGLFLFMCVACELTPATVSGESYKLSAFKDNEAIYFENIGEGDVITSSWTIISYFNLKVYWSEYKNLNQILLNLNSSCADSLSDDYCQSIIRQFDYQWEQIRENNSVNHHNIHHYGLGYFTLVILLLLIGLILYKKC